MLAFFYFVLQRENANESYCGARYLPRLSKAFVSYRPLPLAQVALSATGGAPIAPPSGVPSPAGRQPFLS